MSDSKRQIEEDWSLEDVLDAHLWLDVAEDMGVLIDQEIGRKG